jgi:ABC-type multidrug transport system fused ATPase/permease subunit
MFNTSIRENLLFAKSDATEEEMIEALKAANAWDFIRINMGEKGLDTMIGGTGGQLSGG